MKKCKRCGLLKSTVLATGKLCVSSSTSNIPPHDFGEEEKLKEAFEAVVSEECPELSPHGGEYLFHWWLSTLHQYQQEVKKLIAEEMIICREENTPTSRLTSLWNKLSNQITVIPSL